MNHARLNISFDLPRIRQDVEMILSTCAFHPVHNQLCLNHRPGSLASFYEGAGSLFDPQTDIPWAEESDFTEMHPLLKGSYLSEVCENVRELVGGGLGRIRLIRLSPKTCMSVHTDVSPRIHLPVTTNSQSYFIFRDSGLVHFPADGHIYWVNTLLEHSAMNGSAVEDRVHLLFSLNTDERSTLDNIAARLKK